MLACTIAQTSFTLHGSVIVVLLLLCIVNCEHCAMCDVHRAMCNVHFGWSFNPDILPGGDGEACDHQPGWHQVSYPLTHPKHIPHLFQLSTLYAISLLTPLLFLILFILTPPPPIHPLSSKSLPDILSKHVQSSKMEFLFPSIPLRDEKVKVLKAVPELSLADVVLGQVKLQTLWHLHFCISFNPWVLWEVCLNIYALNILTMFV